METTRHKRINRPTTPAQATRLPDPAPASHAEPVVPLEMAQQFVQATHLGHQLGQVSIGGMSGATVQAKLTVGAANDPYEQEADRVAGQVMRMPEPEDDERVQRVTEPDDEDKLRRKTEPEEEETLRRKTDPEEEETLLRKTEPQEEEDILQRAGGAAGFAASSDIEQRIRESRGQGSALPAATQTFMEPRFGADFSQVRVHSDAQADQLNRQLSARAFTTGSDIYFRQGAYAPGSASGQELLAHELTHVVQQGAAGQRIQREDGDDDDTSSTTKKPADPVAGLKMQIAEQRSEIYAIQRENPQMLRSEADDLEIVLRKLNTLSAQITAEPDQAKELMKAFKVWREGDGYTSWQTFIMHRDARAAAKKAQEDREAREAAETAARRAAASAVVVWSPECDAVFADMNGQFGRWDGTKTNRGAWWGAAHPGSKAGARRVPDGVIHELRRRVHNTPWRFSDSFTGGISFHRTRGTVDFIYHMLPP